MLRASLVAALIGLASPALADEPGDGAGDPPPRPRPTASAPT